MTNFKAERDSAETIIKHQEIAIGEFTKALAAERKRADDAEAREVLSKALADDRQRVADLYSEEVAAHGITKAALTEANAEIERLTRLKDSARRELEAVRAEAQRNADEDTHAWAEAKLAKAALRRALAALREARDALFVIPPDVATIAEHVDAILADESCVAAGEYVTALEREHEAAIALERSPRHTSASDYHALREAHRSAIAAVDARKANPR
jgi:hypothetical protein